MGRRNMGRPKIFQERTVPADSRLAGWSALVHLLSIKAPVRHPCAVSEQHISGSRREDRGWAIFDKRYWPGEDFGSQLEFALRFENVDPLILKRVFETAPRDAVEKFIRSAPTGTTTRRAWFWYEFLTGRTLDIPELTPMAAIDLLDENGYFTGARRLSRRHKVRNNLLGTSQFCPVVRRTKLLTEMTARQLGAKANEIIGQTGANVVARAASFLLLADSRASFAIEGERPPRGRLERWARAVLQAGNTPLTLEEILRLHSVLIEDRRFVGQGLRPEGVFLGQRDDQGDPLPEFIGARAKDLDGLMAGMIEANNRMKEDGIDPIIQAAVAAFGFVYIHPFQDGNGRLHRCLIHHVLAERRFTPPGMVFPVSSVMLARIDAYRDTLRAHSGPLMSCIEWHPTPERNVKVENETGDLYRYFDCTDNAEFLYGCVAQTIDHDLLQEIDYLKRRDEAMQRMMETVEMPDRLAENLLTYIRKNNGALGKKRRENEFSALTDTEVAALEAIVREVFEEE